MSEICKSTLTKTALLVNHSGQFPSVTISFNLPPGGALGEAVDQIEDSMRNIGLPETIKGNFAGTAQAFQSSLKNEPLLISGGMLAADLYRARDAV